MKLEKIRITRTPGIESPFSIDSFSDGVNVIVGPNGIGKSTLSRTIRQFLWSETTTAGTTIADAVFTIGDKEWQVHRDGNRFISQCEGIETDFPDHAPSHLQGCFFFGLTDLLDSSKSAGHTFASLIRLQMSGGYDLGEIRSRFSKKAGNNFGRRERNALNAIDSGIQKAKTTQSQLIAKFESLDGLRSQLAEARQAQNNLTQIEKAFDLTEDTNELSLLQDQLDELPQEIGNLNGSELEVIENREGQIESLESQLGNVNEELSQAKKEVSNSPLDASLDPKFLSEWRERTESISSIETQLLAAEVEYQKLDKKVSEATEYLNGKQDESSEFTIPKAAELFEFLGKSQKIKNELQTIRERQRLLENIVGPDVEKLDYHEIEKSIDVLRAWLRLPEHYSGPTAEKTGKTTARPAR